MSKPVAILGCGPAGLLAAVAARRAKRKVVILSMKKKSPIGGAQYLHRAIPGLTETEPTAWVKHRVRGDALIYLAKAYGDGAQPDFVSFQHVADGMAQPAWNLRKAYDQLWEVLNGLIEPTQVSCTWLQDNRNKFSLIVSAVPRKALCVYHDPRIQVQGNGTHRFEMQEIQILNRCLPGGPEGPDNTLYYDGSDGVSWYRASRIFGTGSTEWGSAIRLPFPASEIVKVWKPVSTNCLCHSNMRNLLHVGRFGKWKKGELTHHAYENVLEALA